jgi:hypothetical protein
MQTLLPLKKAFNLNFSSSYSLMQSFCEAESVRRERIKVTYLKLKMPRNEVAKQFRAADLERVLTETKMEKEMSSLLESCYCEIFPNFGEKREIASSLRMLLHVVEVRSPDNYQAANEKLWRERERVCMHV